MEREGQYPDDDDARGGKFTDLGKSLLTSFDEGGSSQRWREAFGLEQARPVRMSGVDFTRRARR